VNVNNGCSIVIAGLMLLMNGTKNTGCAKSVQSLDALSLTAPLLEVAPSEKFP
jgi:hypothetical protein